MLYSGRKALTRDYIAEHEIGENRTLEPGNTSTVYKDILFTMGTPLPTWKTHPILLLLL